MATAFATLTCLMMARCYNADLVCHLVGRFLLLRFVWT
jgi:hypothetical protein